VRTKFEIRCFTSFWVRVTNPDPGEEEVVGGGDGTVRKSVGEFLYALHSNFSSIFTCFKNIAAFVLQRTTFPHPTSSLPQISPFSLGVDGWPLGYEKRRFWSVQLVSKISNLCDPDPPADQDHIGEDRRTTTCNRTIIIARFAL